MQRPVIVVLLVLAALFPAFLGAVALRDGSVMARGIAGMATGLIILWIFGVGSQMWRLRDSIRVSTAVERPARWRRKSLPVLVGFPCSVGGRFLVPA